MEPKSPRPFIAIDAVSASSIGSRWFSGLLVQAVVQAAESVAATSDGLSLGTWVRWLWRPEVAGSIPVVSTRQRLDHECERGVFYSPLADMRGLPDFRISILFIL